MSFKHKSLPHWPFQTLCCSHPLSSPPSLHPSLPPHTLRSRQLQTNRFINYIVFLYLGSLTQDILPGNILIYSHQPRKLVYTETWAECVTWCRCVGLGVGGGASGWGFSRGVGLSCLLVLLQFSHPWHRPLTVHMLKLLNLGNQMSQYEADFKCQTTVTFLKG